MNHPHQNEDKITILESNILKVFYDKKIGFKIFYLEHLLKFWCRRGESNTRPTDYESVALPAELLRHEVDLKMKNEQ